MKKLFAILLICLFLLSMAACNARDVIDAVDNIGNGDSSQQGSTMTPADDQVEGGAISSDKISQGTDNPNEIGTTVVIVPGDGGISAGDGSTSGEGDTAIKVEINNSTGESSDPVVSTTPPDDTNNSFVIDFDQLLDASDSN